jgi:DNA polymerase
MKQISAGIIIYRKTREGLKFLLLYHGHGYWNFPKGKIESKPRYHNGVAVRGGEKSLQAALRETKEETGLRPNDLKIQKGFKVYERYIFRERQEQIFKIVIFYLAETRKPQIFVSREHSGYGWFTLNEAQKILTKKYHKTAELLKKAYDFLQRKNSIS